MAYMLSLLRELRSQPGMYVGTNSITKLAAFLRGYEHAATGLAPHEKDDLLKEFRDWIHQRLHATDHSWEEAILNGSTDEADAAQRFWKLLDEFLLERSTEEVNKSSAKHTANWRFGKRDYEIVCGSDVANDSFFAELNDTTNNTYETVMFASRSDLDGRITVSAYRADLPLELVEWFFDIAKRRLPPCDGS